jgi:hypothetical protein
MNAARSLIPFALTLVAPLVAAQPSGVGEPKLSVVLQPGVVEFHITQQLSPFVGIVLGSFSPDLQHFLTGLPPLLNDAVVLDMGLDTAGTFQTRFRDISFPPGIMIYSQGVTISEAGILSSNVDSFVLDGTGSN